MNKGRLKSNRGITLVTLIITIVVIFIVAGTTVYTSLDRFEINRLQKMYNDIELLSNKVSSYYLKYNGLPIKEQYMPTLNFDKNVNDSGYYYIIDLSAMDGISLNYGEEGFNKPNASADVYIINEVSHTIYYVKGIEVDGKMYYTIPKEENSINDTIPPTKPEIKIISGTMNSEGKYTSEVEVEIVPGKDNWSGIDKTTYSINDGTETDITTLANNILKITESGSYTIKARSYDKNGNISEYTITECQYECDHDWETTNEYHRCKNNCGIWQSHTYENGKCTVCGYECSHSYSYGICEYCGKSCSHDWEITDEYHRCKNNCGIWESHNWVYYHNMLDICTVCGRIRDTEW